MHRTGELNVQELHLALSVQTDACKKRLLKRTPTFTSSIQGKRILKFVVRGVDKILVDGKGKRSR